MTRATSVRTAWSAAEDDALLRAWMDVVERRPKSQAKGLLQFYHTLCGADVRRERTLPALQTRRAMFVRMYDIISAFHTHMQDQQQTKQGSGDNSGTGEAVTTASEATKTQYSSGDWFALPVREQKRWFASLDTKSYPFHEIQRDHFERVGEILKLSVGRGKGDFSRRQATYTRPRAEEAQEDGNEEGDDKVEDDAWDPLSTTHIRATIDRLKRPAQCTSSGGCIRAHRYANMPEQEDEDAIRKSDAVGGGNVAVSADGDDSDGGSSTESDEEILSCWNEDGDAIVPRSPVLVVTTESRTETEPTIKKLQEDPFERQSEQQPPRKQMDNVDPDLLELVSILETQARHLGEMFRRTKKARKEESWGRRCIMKNIQLDRDERNRVLEDLKRREEELQRECEEWQLERSSMKRELAQLREQMSARHEETAERPE